MADLNPRINDETRIKPRDNVKEWQLGGENQNISLGGCLIEECQHLISSG